MSEVQLVLPEILPAAVSYPPFGETRSPGLPGHRECQADSDAGVYKTGVDRVSPTHFDGLPEDELPFRSRRKLSMPARGTEAHVSRNKGKKN